jgi:hypothetical protein
MPDSDLRSRLAALRPPGQTESTRARALHRASCALAVATRPAPAPRRLFPLLLGAAIATAAAFALGLWIARPAAPPASPRLASQDPASSNAATAPTAADSLQLLAQVHQLFPGRLNAVIERDGSLQLDLSPAAAALVADQPLLVEFTHGGHTVRVLGFSGRSVELELDGRPLRFSPLLTGEGSILITGEDFAWTPGLPPPLAFSGWQVNARPLAAPVL